jgi:hypothetical protein
MVVTHEGKVCKFTRTFQTEEEADEWFLATRANPKTELERKSSERLAKQRLARKKRLENEFKRATKNAEMEEELAVDIHSLQPRKLPSGEWRAKVNVTKNLFFERTLSTEQEAREWMDSIIVEAQEDAAKWIAATRANPPRRRARNKIPRARKKKPLGNLRHIEGSGMWRAKIIVTHEGKKHRFCRTCKTEAEAKEWFLAARANPQKELERRASERLAKERLKRQQRLENEVARAKKRAETEAKLASDIRSLQPRKLPSGKWYAKVYVTQKRFYERLFSTEQEAREWMELGTNIEEEQKERARRAAVGRVKKIGDKFCGRITINGKRRQKLWPTEQQARDWVVTHERYYRAKFLKKEEKEAKQKNMAKVGGPEEHQARSLVDLLLAENNRRNMPGEKSEIIEDGSVPPNPHDSPQDRTTLNDETSNPKIRPLRIMLDL